jgi:hypothetical protein
VSIPAQEFIPAPKGKGCSLSAFGTGLNPAPSLVRAYGTRSEQEPQARLKPGAGIHSCALWEWLKEVCL